MTELQLCSKGDTDKRVVELSVTSALNVKKILYHYKQTRYIILESLLMRHSIAYMILHVCLKKNKDSP